MMNLNNFERFIEPKIVSRGEDYYHEGYIESVERLSANEFSAEVCGTDFYSVYVRLGHNNTIQEASCDCPYEWGNECKHIVAVLFHIREDISSMPIPKESHSTSKPNLIEQIRSIAREDLEVFLYEMMKTNGVLRQEFKEWFPDK